MMEKLGQAKTHLELKKMIAEVDTNNSGDGGNMHACVILAFVFRHCTTRHLISMQVAT